MTYQPDKDSLDARPIPDWYRDAKLGIFVHWGLYSIPAFAERTDSDYSAFMRDLIAGKGTADRIPYAEWYLNGLRVPGSPTNVHHVATYGRNFSYFDFRTNFETHADRVDFADWASLFSEAGARYIVMVTRHLDGYPLWPTRVEHPHMPRDYRSRRDLVGDLTKTVREHGMRMGLYYGGGTDWTFVTKPIKTMTDLMRHQALGPDYAHYAAAQWRELIDTYQPSVVWNDMGWPADYDPHQLMVHYYNSVADGVVNDRWTQLKMPRNRLARSLYLRFVGQALKAMAKRGRSMPERPPTFHYDVATHEYAAPATVPSGAWELTRGLGKSFGYNAQETSADTLTGKELIHLLADVVANGGNLLLNVGPDGEGRIPHIQQAPLRALGTWLGRNAQAVYGTRPWTRNAANTTSGDEVRFTRNGRTTYAIVLADQPAGTVTIRDLNASETSRISVLGGAHTVPWQHSDTGLQIELPPEQQPQKDAYVLSITPA
ncbi:alpha-L-fucosidase [Micromonospora avicenniae]|uniref:alpha-L-fucosidase n=1 Tax=Micromonospora avicenniae TaxID=1198245 RepID=UPI003329B080